MSEAEAKLTVLWDAATAPVRDGAFRIAVLARLEQRRLRDRVLVLTVWSALASAFIWLAAPQLSFFAVGHQGAMTIMMSAGALVWAAFAVTGGLRRHF